MEARDEGEPLEVQVQELPEETLQSPVGVIRWMDWDGYGYEE